MKNMTRLYLSVLLSVALGLTPARGQSSGRLKAEFDHIISSEFKAGEPGGVAVKFIRAG